MRTMLFTISNNWKAASFSILMMLVFYLVYRPNTTELHKQEKNGNLVLVYEPRMSMMNLEDVEMKKFSNGWSDMKHPRFLEFLRNHWFVAPSNPVQGGHGNWWEFWNWGRSHYSQFGESEIIDKLLNKKRNGYFVECGAADGLKFSNSLFFEESRNWTGLLIEANPMSYQKLMDNKRNAHSINACLSLNKSSHQTRFISDSMIGGIESAMDRDHRQWVDHRKTAKFHNAQCFPFNALVNALKVTHVDYFSLDIEGPELEVLKTINFNDVFIDVMTVEFFVENQSRRNETLCESKLQNIKTFFNTKWNGLYKEVGILTRTKQLIPSNANNYKDIVRKQAVDVVFERTRN